MWYNLVHHVLQSAFQATSSSRLIAAMARRKPGIELIYDAVQLTAWPADAAFLK
jgi:hypothetical protein